MNFKGAILSGTLSRSPETIKIHRLLRDGHAKKTDFEKAVEKDSNQIIQAQKNFAFVSGGQLNWLDLLRPIASNFKGFAKGKSEKEDSVGPVTRWFRTNTFYRKPTIVEKISSNGKELSQNLPKIENNNGILFLLGPYSFSKLVQNSFYENEKELILDYAKAINQNISDLKQKGYGAIFFSEPSIGFDFSKKELKKEMFFEEFASNIKEILKGINFPLTDASNFFPLIEETDFDFVGIDCIFSDFEKIKTKKNVFLGLTDGSRIGVESLEQINKIVQNFKQKASAKDYFIGPNDRLFDVPFEQGLKKIKILSDFKE